MDGIFKKHLFLHPLTQSLTHLSYLEDVYCLLIDGLLTFFKSIIFISAATFYVGAYQITPKHLNCLSMIYSTCFRLRTSVRPAKKSSANTAATASERSHFGLTKPNQALQKALGGKFSGNGQ